jgi:putative transcriptional regulator
VYSCGVKALAPGFLIAMPQLQDPNFEKTVVLMIEHNAQGAMGLVVNRSSKLTFKELAQSQELKIAASREEHCVFVGGPVEPFRGFVLHDSQAVAERLEVLPGLYLTVTSDALEPLLLDPHARVRFCLGCSGWGPGQLEHELTTGSWLFTEAAADSVLAQEPERVWESVIKGMGIDPGWLVTSGGLN